MSFSYFPFYTGDYLRDTRTLSMAGHGAYTLMLWYCWDTKGPLPLDEKDISAICNARSQDETATMQRVLHHYFVRMEDGWYQKRVMMEIERCAAISGKRSNAAHERWKARELLRKIDANAKQMQSKCNANAPSPSPSPSPSPRGKAKASAAITPPPPGVNPTVWEAWRKHRGQKLTATAAVLQAKRLAEFAAAGDDPNAVIEQSICNGWSGLFPLKRPKAGVGDERARQRAQAVAGLTGGTSRREPRVIDPDD